MDRRVVINTEGLSKRYGDTLALDGLELVVGEGEVYGYLGPNGSGKTTLVETILGRLPLASGSRWIGPSVVVGELGQDRRLLGSVRGDGAGGDETVVDALTRSTGSTLSEARSLLAKFGLGAEAATRRPAVVGHEEQRAVKARQCCLQLLDRGEVEVVRGFVEYQEIDAGGGERGKLGPGALAR